MTKNERDRLADLMWKWSISFEVKSDPTKWPAWFHDRFRQIQDLGVVRFDAYVKDNLIRSDKLAHTVGAAKHVPGRAIDGAHADAQEEDWRDALETPIFSNYMVTEGVHNKASSQSCVCRLTPLL